MASDQQILQQLPEMGRDTDTVLAHMTLGEVVLPRQFMEDEEAAAAIQSIFEAYGVDIREFTVGDEANKINPETGYPEFFFKRAFRAVRRVVKRAAPIAAPILGTMIPGVGPIVGGALGGALGGAASGRGLKGILTGGALGAAGGGLSSALKGGMNIPGLGSGAGASLATTTGNAAMQGPTQGTGLLGALTKGASSTGGGISSLAGGNTSMFGNALKIGGSILEDSSTRKNNEAIQRQLAEAQQRAQGQLNPYTEAGADATGRLSESLAAGFNPGDLTQDPGYQFRLQQGEEALARRMSASGLGQSGAALKASQEYGQGLADQTYNDAFQRYQATNQQNQVLSNQGLGAADRSAGLDMYGGQNMAELLAANQESKNKRLAGILGGIGGFF